MEHKINTKWLVSAAAVLVIGILLMLNFYGYRSMNFELKKAGAASDSEQVLYEHGTSLIPKANMSLRLKEAERLRLNLLKEIRLEAEKQELLLI